MSRQYNMSQIQPFSIRSSYTASSFFLLPSSEDANIFSSIHVIVFYSSCVRLNDVLQNRFFCGSSVKAIFLTAFLDVICSVFKRRITECTEIFIPVFRIVVAMELNGFSFIDAISNSFSSSVVFFKSPFLFLWSCKASIHPI